MAELRGEIWAKNEVLGEDSDGDTLCSRTWFSLPDTEDENVPCGVPLGVLRRLLLAAGFLPTGEYCDDVACSEEDHDH